MSEERHSEIGIHLIDPEDVGELLRRRQIVRRAGIATIAVLVLLALGAGRTVWSRMANAKVLEEGSSERGKQYVKVAQPRASGPGQTLVLPGTLQGFVQSPISARASGYLAHWYKDIGSRVNQGELLAEIETPEIDQQLTQGIAAREQAASSLALAKSSMERWEALRQSMLLRVQISRVESAFLRGRAAVQRAANQGGDKRLSAMATKDANLLRREGVGYAACFAASLDAGLACARGDLEHAVERLGAAERSAVEAGMSLHAAAARRGRGVGAEAERNGAREQQPLRAPQRNRRVQRRRGLVLRRAHG